MALYYLNRNSAHTTFYTDAGSIMDVLRFAEQNELISIPYLLGRHRRTNKLMFLRDKRCSNELNSGLRNYLPASIQAKFILDSEIIVSDFVVHFQNGDRAYTDKGDVIVKLKAEDKVSDVLEAFNVPIRICPSLLAQPGTLINAIKRTETSQSFGYFKTIEDWLNLGKIEKGISKLCENLN